MNAEFCVPALVLAAGFSSRMGRFKPLLPVGGESALSRVVSALRGAGVGEIAVVTGYEAERLRPQIAALSLREVYNPDYAGGMFTSVLAGLRALSERADGVLLTPVDCPLIPPEAVKAVLERAKARPDCFVVPTCRGKRGHPLFIPRAHFAEILAHDGTQGLKGVTRRYTPEAVETGREEIFLDMDTPEGYEQILRFERARREGTRLPELGELLAAAGRRVWLLRHGRQRQRSGPIFLGCRTDDGLDETGRAQAQAAAERLRQLAPEAEEVWTSPLLRARETAQIVAQALNLPLHEEAAFSELDLGGLDGRSIDEFRQAEPAAYARRGAELASYKYDANSENFYDLRYRAVTALRRLLAGSQAGTIILVTHAGVIQMLRAEAAGMDVEEGLKLKPPKHGEAILLS